MPSNNDKSETPSVFTEIGKLRHENSFLNERITNLEAFKKNFFTLQNDIIDAREKLAVYEEALNFCQIKNRIIESHETPVDELVIKHTDDIIGYLHDSISANSYEDLVMSIFQSTDDFNIGVGIQVHHNDSILNYALKESDKASNTSLINSHKTDGNIIEKDSYFIVNESHMSLIATNLPNKDTSKGKQIREFLEIITLGANTRIDSLSQRNDLNELKKNIYKIFKKTNESFSTIQNNMDNQVIKISDIFLSFEKNLMSTLVRTNISPAHLDLIKLIVHDSKSDLNLLLTSSLSMDENFMNAMRKLEKNYRPDKQIPKNS